ncbi:hypothetical protein O9929_25420 [Vibrio lentus]|nr:hypothetical protein [Vibrio lentus]
MAESVDVVDTRDNFHLNTTHHDGKRSDGVFEKVLIIALVMRSLKPWHDCSLENGHQLDKTSNKTKSNGYEKLSMPNERTQVQRPSTKRPT